MGSTPDLQLRVLGRLEVVRDGCALDLGPPKQRLLLSVLVARAGEGLSCGRLVDALWGGCPPRSAPENLRSYIHGLRRAVGHELVPAAPGSTPGYRLDPGHARLDSDEFHRSVGAGRAALAAGDLATARTRLRDGLARWRGPAFDGFADEPAITADVAVLEGCRLSVCEQVLDVELRLGLAEAAVAELSVLAVRHPERERLHGLLMRALHRTGRRSEALAVYRRARRHLAEDLGVEPGAELRRIEQAVLRGDDGPDRADRRGEIARLRAENRRLRSGRVGPRSRP